MNNTYLFLVNTPIDNTSMFCLRKVLKRLKRKRPTERMKRRWEYNIKTKPGEVCL